MTCPNNPAADLSSLGVNKNPRHRVFIYIILLRRANKNKNRAQKKTANPQTKKTHQSIKRARSEIEERLWVHGKRVK